MPLKTKQIETFLSDYFSDLKLSLQPENMKLYEKFNGQVPLDEIILISYFAKHHVTVEQLLKAVNLSKIVQLSEHQTYITRTVPIKSMQTLIPQTLIFSSIENSYFSSINKDIKWFVAKQTDIFPKFTEIIKTRIFGDTKFIAKLYFQDREEAYKVYEFFGAQQSWSREKIEASQKFFTSNVWGKTRILGDTNFVERMLNCKDQINKFLIVLRMDDLLNEYPRNCVVEAKITDSNKLDLMKWFTQICKFIYCEYEENIFRVVCKNSPESVSLMHCKHMFNEAIVEFSISSEDNEKRLWEIVINHELEKKRI